MTHAAIDVGTNSVKLLVGRVEGTTVTPLLHRSINTRLGEGLHASGQIAPEAADRTMAALKELRDLATSRGAERVAAVGTLALREAANAAEFLARGRSEAGLDIRILTGQEEARLSYQGASSAAATDEVLAIDIGGGSTEIMQGTRTELARSWSLDLGAVTMTEEFLRSDPPGADEMLTLSAEIRRHLLPVAARAGREGELLGVGGTVSSILALLRREMGEDPREITRRTVAFDTISALAIHLSLKTVAEREQMGLERGRADIMIAGAWLLVAAMSHLEATSLRPTAQGLRHGVLIELSSGRWA
jgi:exopolyphosphatase/guanosine-5'-triphosphate,3'-diphosphate pyrophosphatase